VRDQYNIHPSIHGRKQQQQCIFIRRNPLKKMPDRRRLAHGKGKPAETYGWKPFGNMDYGYGEAYQTYSSFTIWALVTWGSFSVSPIQAALVLGGSVAYAEYNAGPQIGTGASWIHNVQAGFCWYHYFIKGQKQLPLALGSWAEIAGDLGAVAEEWIKDKGKIYSHIAHYEGASIGIVIAMLLDRFNFSSKPTLWKAVPFAAIALMYYRSDPKRKSWTFK
jgi:hypothetical protein